MNDTFLMRRTRGFRELNGNVEEPAERQSPSRNRVRQGLALHHLHRQELNAVLPLRSSES